MIVRLSYETITAITPEEKRYLSMLPGMSYVMVRLGLPLIPKEEYTLIRDLRVEVEGIPCAKEFVEFWKAELQRRDPGYRGFCSWDVISSENRAGDTSGTLA